jgi:sterol 3beta-glucosyltransferase/vancomycin aglycone glucosyltransferase
VPAEVEAFLADGEPPVLLTFGSMRAADAPETHARIEAMLGAVEQAGVRAIVQVPTQARERYASRARVLVTAALPHARVMPRCALVVHHGGAGTRQASVVAGRPSVVVAFLAGQFFWAERLRSLGLALGAQPRNKLRADRLARAISAALATPSLAQRAAEVSHAMRGEDGVRAAAELIEGSLGQRRATSAR